MLNKPMVFLYQLTPMRTNYGDRSRSVLGPAEEMQEGPFQVERQGTATVGGTSRSYGRSAATHGTAESPSGKRKAMPQSDGKVDSLSKISQNMSFNFGSI
jgi:hypothetical protein